MLILGYSQHVDLRPYCERAAMLATTLRNTPVFGLHGRPLDKLAQNTSSSCSAPGEMATSDKLKLLRPMLKAKAKLKHSTKA